MLPYILLLLNILLLVTGQMLWKISVTPISTWNFNSVVQVILSPYFIIGGVLYVLATGLWLIVLSKLPLSIAYPAQSLAYILGIVGAYFIFKENINGFQLCGMLLIMFGVYLIAK